MPQLIGGPGHVTADGLFSWTEVECLGACVNAPMAQINKDYYEDLTPESLAGILNLKAGRTIEPGPQNGRQATAPLDARSRSSIPSSIATRSPARRTAADSGGAAPSAGARARVAKPRAALMLQDKDRILRILYGLHSWRLKAARARGAWDGTKPMIERGPTPSSRR